MSNKVVHISNPSVALMNIVRTLKETMERNENKLVAKKDLYFSK